MSEFRRHDADQDRPALQQRLDRLTLAARAALVWERVWPVLAGLLVVLGLFLTVSWLGLWLEASRPVRIAGGLFFVALALAALAQGFRLRWPGRSEVLSRLDRDSGLAHRPATTLADAPANAAHDPETAALWALHRKRAEEAAARLRVAAPSPRLVEKDRFALRAAVLIAACGAAFVAGPQKYARVAAAFDWRTEGALAKGFRLDAWIDPPPYTGKPPLMLQTKAGDEASAAVLSTTARRIEAPQGSTVVVRSSGGAGLIVETEGALADPAAEKTAVRAEAAALAPRPAPAAARGDADTEQRFLLKGDSRLVLKRGGRIVAAFDLIAIPDKAPTIVLSEPAKTNVRGSISLAYRIADDYGVTGAEALFAKPRINGRAVKGRSLVEAPRLGLQLPAGPGGLGEGQTTGDLSEHPWAGARVAMVLTARDEGGNEGRSEESEITLPQRPFTKPLARALVEQRRNLVLAPDEMKARVSAALDAFMIEPDLFGTSASIYLGLSLAQTRLKAARSDSDLVGVADFLWEMALRIEDGDLSQTERELRAAQQALREALQRGATPEELKKLMDDLRAAMDKFLREFAEQQRREMQRGDRDPQDRDQQDRVISQQDLNSMLDRMEEMAKRGDMADAQRMLDQLQRMLENLQAARPDRNRNSASREMQRQMSELDKMTREQQKLRDDTFRQDQKQGRRGREGQKQRQRNQQLQRDGQTDEDVADGEQGGDGEMDPEALQKQQRALRERLEELKKRMKELGLNGEQGLDDAEQAMREAEKELGDGEGDGQEGQQGQQGQGQGGEQQGQRGKGGKGRDPGKAVDAQGRALQGLRRGQQGLAQQMQRQPGQGDPNGEMADGDDWGEPDPNGRPRRADGTNRDPLDRPRSNDNRFNDHRGMNAGPGAAERARRVLEELQRRLSDPNRPRDELDYLERLLRRY